jgi:hypothetical protein
MAFWQCYGLTHSRFQGASQHEFQTLLYERCKGSLALYRLLASAFQKSFVQAHGSSHASEHTCGMSICQGGGPAKFHELTSREST